MFETVNRIHRKWGIGAFALPVLIAIALVGLVLTHSEPSSWMSDAVQAEFRAAKQLAQPAGPIRTVRSN
jgi:hypothetical protein